MSAWHDWYAWHPVQDINGRWLWLTHVLRQRRIDHFDDPYYVYMAGGL